MVSAIGRRIVIGLQQRLQLRDAVVGSIALVDARRLLDHLRERPERDPLAIGGDSVREGQSPAHRGLAANS